MTKQFGRARVGLLVAALLVLFAGGGFLWHAAGSSQPLETRPEVGYLAPDFTLVTVGGEEVTLSDLRGKRVFLNFWATWCPPCRMEMPAIQSVYDERDDDVVFLAVNIQEPAAKVQAFLEEYAYTFPVLLDAAGQVPAQYLVRAIPTSFAIDAEGVIRDKHIGVLTEQQLREMLEAAK